MAEIDIDDQIKNISDVFMKGSNIEKFLKALGDT